MGNYSEDDKSMSVSSYASEHVSLVLWIELELFQEISPILPADKLRLSHLHAQIAQIEHRAVDIFRAALSGVLPHFGP